MKQWSELMTGFQSEIVRLGEQLDANPNDPTPGSHWTDLIDFADRLDRIHTAFQATPKKTWLNRSKNWQEAWQQQRQAFEFLVSHFKDLLTRSEISRIETRGKKLEVESMTVVGIETRDDLPPETVVSEIRSGYRRHNDILRLAEVTVAKTPSDSVS
jgi:molecular chaperone GrpE (heat shock protein)